MSDTVTCPHCHQPFEISAAFLTEVTARVRSEYEAVRKREDREHQAALDALERRLGQEKKAALEAERKKAQASAIEEAAGEIKALKDEIESKNQKLAESRKQELELRQARQALEADKEEFELEKARQLDAERNVIKEEATRVADERHRLKEEEWHRQREAMGRQIDELRRKAEQGSQELQGEVLELDLERKLHAMWPTDDIDPIAKGKRGADLLQTVADAAGQACGRILWESKRAKNWSGDWLPKLRDDQRAAKAELAVLVTEVLPSGLVGFGLVDGVWVTNRECMAGLATALRTVLQQVAGATRSAQGKQGKMEMLYRYLCGADFHHRITGLVEAFRTMRTDLDKERTVMERHWAKREKELERAIAAASGLYGDIQGIAGAGFPELKELDLKLLGSVAESSDEDSGESTSGGEEARTQAFTF